MVVSSDEDTMTQRTVAEASAVHLSNHVRCLQERAALTHIPTSRPDDCITVRTLPLASCTVFLHTPTNACHCIGLITLKWIIWALILLSASLREGRCNLWINLDWLH